MQTIQDFGVLMSSVVLRKINFHPMAYVDGGSFVDFHMVHIPQLPGLGLKQNCSNKCTFSMNKNVTKHVQ